jgi:hypothetical protein
MATQDKVVDGNRIPIDAGVMVTMPIGTYKSLEELYGKADNYLKHVQEHEVNLAARDKQIVDLQAQIAEKDSRIAKLETDVTDLTDQLTNALSGTSKKASRKKSDKEVKEPEKPSKRTK